MGLFALPWLSLADIRKSRSAMTASKTTSRRLRAVRADYSAEIGFALLQAVKTEAKDWSMMGHDGSRRRARNCDVCLNLSGAEEDREREKQGDEGHRDGGEGAAARAPCPCRLPHSSVFL